MGEVTDPLTRERVTDRTTLDERELENIQYSAELQDRVFEADHKSPERIRNDIQRTRREMDDTLSEIRQRLEFGELANDVFDFAKVQFREKTPDIAGTLKRNPGPLAMLAGGLGWMMYRGTSHNGHAEQKVKERMGEATEGIGEMARETMESVKEKTSQKIRHGRETAKDKMSRTSDRISEGVSHTGEKISQGMRDTSVRVRESFSDTLESSPLAVGAFALAIGAACGLAVPLTHKEEELIDRTTDQVKQDLGMMSQASSEAYEESSEQRDTDLTGENI